MSAPDRPTREQVDADRWKRLTENIAAGRSPLDDKVLETIRANAAVGLDVPPPRVLQLAAEVRALRAELDSAPTAEAYRAADHALAVWHTRRHEALRLLNDYRTAKALRTVKVWVEQIIGVLDAPVPPLPAVPDGEEKAAFVPPTTTAETDRKIATVELRGLTACRCEAAWRDRGLHEPMKGCASEYREDVDILSAAARGQSDAAEAGEDVPARLDAAAEALEALHSHGLGYELRQVADQLRDGDGGTPELRAAVAAALALPTETQK